MTMKLDNPRKAFMLLELLAVVVILGAIALILMPRINLSSASAREAACFQNKAEINAATERYQFENGFLPNNINDLDDAAYFPDGLPRCPVSDRNYVLQGSTGRINGHTTGSH